jgi:hypothetical protein
MRLRSAAGARASALAAGDATWTVHLTAQLVERDVVALRHCAAPPLDGVQVGLGQNLLLDREETEQLAPQSTIVNEALEQD